MAKLICILAFFIALLTVVQATGNQQLGKCLEEMESQSQKLRSCHQFLTAPFEHKGDDEEHEFKDCCEGLDHIEEPCRCEAMAAVAWDIQETAAEKGQETESDLKKIWAAASSLPDHCHIGGPLRCPFDQPPLIRLFRS